MQSIQRQPSEKTPLVLDVDGTLLRTDMLYETFWAALGHALFATLKVVLTSMTNPARMKRELLAIARPQAALLPVRQRVLDLAHAAAQEGRPVHLASGSDQSLVDELGAALRLPGPHYGSDGNHNLTGHNKAAFLKKRFGEGCYDYVGNSYADLPAWSSARKIIAVAPHKGLARQIAKIGKPVEKLANGWGLRDVVKELRPHQWVKNILLFVPLLVAHKLDAGPLVAVLMSAVAFSIGASSIYILNDMLDLEADRKHPEKRNRPIACGRLPIKSAMAISTLMVIVALGLSFAVSPAVAALTFTYMFFSLVYSLWLKKLKWVDLLTLASLFLMRVLTGAVAGEVSVSGWLLAFLFLAFFSLACVKRMTALARAFKGGKLPGRGYGHKDFPRLQKAAFMAVGVASTFFGFYTFSAEAARLYGTPWLLFLALGAMVIWLVRVIRLSEKGKEDYDPVVFVTKDKLGLAIAALSIGLIFLAV